jgi:hypothetical protein
VQVTPEFDAVARLAVESGTPQAGLMAAVVAAAAAAGLVPGSPVPGTGDPAARSSAPNVP